MSKQEYSNQHYVIFLITIKTNRYVTTKRNIAYGQNTGVKKKDNNTKIVQSHVKQISQKIE